MTLNKESWIVEALDSPHTTFQFVDELKYSPVINLGGFSVVCVLGMELQTSITSFPSQANFSQLTGDL